MTAAANKAALTLRKPRAISGKAAWFEAYYVVGPQKMRDRHLVRELKPSAAAPGRCLSADPP